MKAEKKCSKCGITRPLDEFYEHRGMKDGRLGKCKKCARHEAFKNYCRRKTEGRPQKTARENRPPVVRARAREFDRAWEIEACRNCPHLDCRGVTHPTCPIAIRRGEQDKARIPLGARRRLERLNRSHWENTPAPIRAAAWERES